MPRTIAQVDEQLQRLDASVHRLEGVSAVHESRLDDLSNDIARLDRAVEEFGKKLTTLLIALMGGYLALAGALLVAVLRK